MKIADFYFCVKIWFNNGDRDRSIQFAQSIPISNSPKTADAVPEMLSSKAQGKPCYHEFLFQERWRQSRLRDKFQLDF